MTTSSAVTELGRALAVAVTRGRLLERGAPYAYDGPSAGYVLRHAPKLLCLRSQLPLISDAPVEWIHVAYEGEWHGHHSGSFQLTRERFEQACANFERQVNAVKLDFDHETVLAPDGTPVPARGYVHELAIRDSDGVAHLWALAEFGPEAVEINRDRGGYRFNSAVFDFNGTDRVTGEGVGLVLRSIALTDDPFIDGQQPIMLTRACAGGPMTTQTTREDFEAGMRLVLGAAQDKRSALLALLNIDEAALSEEEREDSWGLAYNRFSAVMTAAQQEDVIETPAAEADLALAAPGGAEGDPVDEKTDAMIAACNACAEACAACAAEPTQETMDACLAACEACAEACAEAGAASTKTGEGDATAAALAREGVAVKALSGRLEAAEVELSRFRGAEADRWADSLVTSGRLLDNARAEWRAIYLSNRVQAEQLAMTLPAAVPVALHASAVVPPTEGTPALDEGNERVKALRVAMSRTTLPKDAVDAAIRREIAKDQPARV